VTTDGQGVNAIDRSSCLMNDVRHADCITHHIDGRGHTRAKYNDKNSNNNVTEGPRDAP